MTSFRTTAFALVLGAAVPVFAAAPPASQVPALERAESQLSQRASQNKGGPQHRLLMERERVRGLLDDLKAGRSVPPEDVDRALENAERAY